MEGIGFRKDVGSYSCTPVPKGGNGVSYWSKYDVEPRFTLGLPLARITADEIPPGIESQAWPVVNDYFIEGKIPGNRTLLTSLHVDGEEVQAAFFDGRDIVFQRLGHQLRLACPTDLDPERRFDAVLRWSHDRISLAINYALPSGDFRETGIEKTFSLALLPPHLMRVLWDSATSAETTSATDCPGQSAIHNARTSYVDSVDFTATILNTLAEVRRLLLKAKPSGYWDQDSEHWTPKTEPRCGDSLRTIFDSLFAAKNIRVWQEDPARSGRCDFVFTGTLDTYKQIAAVLELKKADSPKLLHGLTHQLPTYLSERDIGIGIYGVLWFKGSRHASPEDGCLDECIERLIKNKPESVASIVGFDVAFKTPASM